MAFLRGHGILASLIAIIPHTDATYAREKSPYEYIVLKRRDVF